MNVLNKGFGSRDDAVAHVEELGSDFLVRLTVLKRDCQVVQELPEICQDCAEVQRFGRIKVELVKSDVLAAADGHRQTLKLGQLVFADGFFRGQILKQEDEVLDEIDEKGRRVVPGSGILGRLVGDGFAGRDLVGNQAHGSGHSVQGLEEGQPGSPTPASFGKVNERCGFFVLWVVRFANKIFHDNFFALVGSRHDERAVLVVNQRLPEFPDETVAGRSEVVCSGPETGFSAKEFFGGNAGRVFLVDNFGKRLDQPQRVGDGVD